VENSQFKTIYQVESSPQQSHVARSGARIEAWKALKQTLRVHSRAFLEIHKSKQSVFKLFSPKSSGIFRRQAQISR
jgi:hypothetical protein